MLAGSGCVFRLKKCNRATIQPSIRSLSALTNDYQMGHAVKPTGLAPLPSKAKIIGLRESSDTVSVHGQTVYFDDVGV